VPEFSEQQKL